MSLASYAITDENSKGRQYPIKKAQDRDEFERDFDRILHSGAHRKLRAKLKFSHMMQLVISIVVDMIIQWKYARLQNL